jgi:hypothetical protein
VQRSARDVPQLNVTHRDPDAAMPLVRICGGGGQQ